MLTNFDKSLSFLLSPDIEGGFSDNKKDPGGVTNHGVTLSTWQQWQRRDVTIQEMRDLTVEQVSPLYRTRYWDAVKASSLPSGVDLMVFDCAVNCGVPKAIRLLQKAVGVSEDGSIGPVTLTALKEKDTIDIIDEYMEFRREHYKSLSDFDTFGDGWMKRCDLVEKQARELAGLPEKTPRTTDPEPHLETLLQEMDITSVPSLLLSQAS